MNGAAGVPGRATVVGAGVVGLSTALELARRGWRVQVVTEQGGPSASSSAAGMLAPASEALLDGMAPAAAAVLLGARSRWNVWAARIGLPLDTQGALHLAPAQVLDTLEVHARRLGLDARRRDGGLWLPQDALVDPVQGLARLHAAASQAGVTMRHGRAQVHDGALSIEGVALSGAVIITAGWGSAALAAAAPELCALEPIKGQLLRIEGTSASGPVLRTTEVYLAPGPVGWTVGATMERGRCDLDPDPQALAGLRAAAVSLRPELAGGNAQAAVGVRAATRDGRPLVGRSRSGVWLATGMRRNGWLLAPLVAETLATMLDEGDAQAAPQILRQAWDPGRADIQQQRGARRLPTASERL